MLLLILYTVPTLTTVLPLAWFIWAERGGARGDPQQRTVTMRRRQPRIAWLMTDGAR
jgi:hypothetical protein